MAMTLRRALRVVLALRANDLGYLELHQLVHHAEPDAHAERQQALPRRPDQLAERVLDLRWQRTLRRPQAVATSGAGTFFMAVPPVLSDLVGACHARNASGRGGRSAVQISTRSRTTSSRRRSRRSSLSWRWAARSRSPASGVSRPRSAPASRSTSRLAARRGLRPAASSRAPSPARNTSRAASSGERETAARVLDGDPLGSVVDLQISTAAWRSAADGGV